MSGHWNMARLDDDDRWSSIGRPMCMFLTGFDVSVNWHRTSRLRSGTAATPAAETMKPRRRIVFHQRRLEADDSHLFCLPPTSPDSIPSPTGFDNLGPETEDIPNPGMSLLFPALLSSLLVKHTPRVKKRQHYTLVQSSPTIHRF